MAKKKTAEKPVSVMKTYEIRKIIKAPNIVEAFNADPITPPEYIVMTDDGEEGVEINSKAIGFDER